MDEIRDWPEFLNVLKAADEVAGCKVRSEAALTLMFEALSQYSLDDIKRAVAAHIQTSPFAIKPADIVKYLSGSAEDRSVYAWRVFVQALGRYGYYDSVAFPDPAYHFAIIRLGGWEKVSQEYGQLSERELQFRAKEWRSLYEAGLRCATWEVREGMIQVPRYLWGFWERDNRENGYLEHIPQAINIDSGERFDQLGAGDERMDNIVALPKPQDRQLPREATL